ncbi:hypothetical protein Pint_35975 [Pistacia integerrima]|uniref:Uncharacterized protein n=1 Tax=Pistacia integerrima TaxID=434235 RepID=A0ACC0Y1F8_9ROSI|nr:hypothetical protein Pint_35975 [Pistacia integerrima]
MTRVRYLCFCKSEFWLQIGSSNCTDIEKYEFQHPQPKRPKLLRIYEAHVGMSGTVCFSFILLTIT